MDIYSKYRKKIIDGKAIAEEILQKVQEKITVDNLQVKLGIVLASNDPASHKYVEIKTKKAAKVGIETKLYHFDEATTKNQLINEIRKFRNNEAIHGVLIQVPFYDHLKPYTTEIIDNLLPLKDVDGLTALRQGMASHFTLESFPPATVEAILECINYCTDEDLTWDTIRANPKAIKFFREKNVLVVNNTDLIGKPLASILTSLDATVFITNKHTKNLKLLSKEADIIISATGETNIFTHEDVKDGSILIDVTSVHTGDTVKGDFVISEKLLEKVSFITPVPGGVGPLTIACLLRNLIR